MNTKELRSQSFEELTVLKESFAKEKMKLRFMAANNSLNQTHQVKIARRNLARILTLLAEKKNEEISK